MNDTCLLDNLKKEFVQSKKKRNFMRFRNLNRYLRRTLSVQRSQEVKEELISDLTLSKKKRRSEWFSVISQKEHLMMNFQKQMTMSSIKGMMKLQSSCSMKNVFTEKAKFNIQCIGVLGFWGFGVLGFWGFGVNGQRYTTRQRSEGRITYQEAADKETTTRSQGRASAGTSEAQERVEKVASQVSRRGQERSVERVQETAQAYARSEETTRQAM